MRKLKAPGKTAKAFLTALAPMLLQACGVAPVQNIFGLRVNLQAEVTKRIMMMPEETAEKALAILKEALKQYEGV